MIEVEIRGALTEESFKSLKSFLDENGELVESHEREMIMLRGYEGYDHNPNERQTDIRLRKTNDKVEIMLKQKVGENNISRKELSLGLAEGSWDTAKEILKAFGYSEGNWMSRKKDIYTYNDVEWSLVEAPDKYFYYEAEKEVEEGVDLQTVHDDLIREALALGLSVLNPQEMHDFIMMLDKKVNKEVTW